MPLPPDEDPCLWIMDEDKFGRVGKQYFLLLPERKLIIELNSYFDYIAK
jgi:hypothetical protein